MVKKKEEEFNPLEKLAIILIIAVALMFVISMVVFKYPKNICNDNLGEERDSYSYESIDDSHYNCCWKEPEIVIDRHDSNRWELIKKCEAFEK